jgi:hypothetical protein
LSSSPRTRTNPFSSTCPTACRTFHKLLLGQGKKKETLLFNLADDLAESNNLAAKHPEKVAELTALLEARNVEITKNVRLPRNATKPHPWPDKL